MFERTTDRARLVLQIAEREALRHGANSIAPEHVLLGLINEKSGVACNVLENLLGNNDKLRVELEKKLPPPVESPKQIEVTFEPSTQKILTLAVKATRRLEHNYIGTEHLLIAICEEGQNAAAAALNQLGLSTEKIIYDTIDFLGVEQERNDPAPSSQISLWLNHTQSEKLSRIALEEGRTVQDVLRNLVERA